MPRNATGLAPVARLKGMKRMPGDAKKPVDIPQPIQVEGFLRIVDSLVQEIWQRLGGRPEDENVAQRVAKLKESLYKTSEGTLPELVVYDWLEQNHIPFSFQAFVYGGRNRAGGIIPDFLVWPGGRGLAWFIQTNYWHGKPEKQATDTADHIRLLGAVVEGIKIEKVVELWEDRVYRDRPIVFQMALAGVELGR